MTTPAPVLAVPLAVFCAAECDLSGVLCCRINCDGNHHPTEQGDWAEPTNDAGGPDV